MAAVKQELVHVENAGLPGEIVRLMDPDTGELVDLADASRELCSRVLGRTELAIQDHLDYLRSAKRVIGARLIKMMDENVSWTTYSRGVKVSAPSPTAGTVTYDPELLDSILAGLVAKKVISEEAKQKAVSQRVETVTHPAGIKALLKIPKAARAMKRAQRVAEQGERRVTVKITDPGEL